VEIENIVWVKDQYYFWDFSKLGFNEKEIILDKNSSLYTGKKDYQNEFLSCSKNDKHNLASCLL
jgi:hypothetical protein